MILPMPSASMFASTMVRPEFDTQACATPRAANWRIASMAPGLGSSSTAWAT